jgi:hypothetical protein
MSRLAVEPHNRPPFGNRRWRVVGCHERHLAHLPIKTAYLDCFVERCRLGQRDT